MLRSTRVALALLLHLAAAACATPTPDDAPGTPPQVLVPSDTAAGDEGDEGDDPVPDDVQRAEVTWVIDGDTIDVEVLGPGGIPPGEHRIRLLEIDTPEREDDCYQTATDLLAELIPVGGEVWLQRDTEDLDPNGRYLRYVWTAADGLVNEDMVAEGMAEAFIFPLNRRHEGRILAAEAQARDLGLGIWGAYCVGRP